MKNKLFTLIILTAAIFTWANADCKYQLFNVTANDNVTVGDIVQHISNECSYTVVVKDSQAQKALKKPLYLLNLKDATVDELLEVVLSENDLNYTVQNNVLRISYLFTETFFVDYIGSDRQGQSSTNINLTSSTENDSGSSESSSMTNITSGDEFIFWSKLQNEINSILNRPEDSYSNTATAVTGEKEEAAQLKSDILINKEAGLVTVTGTKKQVNRVSDYIDKLHNRLKKQVLIDVHILSVKLDNSRTTGIDWSQIYALQSIEIGAGAMSQKNVAEWSSEAGEPPSDISYQLGTLPRNGGLIDFAASASINEIIKFLKDEGDVTALSNPKILTLNNQPALISVGNEYFYKVTSSTTTAGDGATTTAEDEEINSVFAGVLLDVTPEISNDGMITLKVNPSISDTLSSVSTTTERNMPPDLTRRQISSVITIKDGQHAVLGGLIKSSDGVESSKVPILGDIPILNYAFKRETVTKTLEELVIIITPKIVSQERDVNLEELGYKKLER